MVKQQINITIDKQLLENINEKAKNSIYRNRSHFIEIALENYIKKAQS